ncbi:DinB family protein [Haloferula sargassicola]|uniref:DinB-like domain-containing protein n=1 Tax=Haloferula sargassicola TaxID=490096 RepID=A0ABP9UNC7_9BACT
MAHEPQLAPPGAGLPWPELMIARFLFARHRRRGREAHGELFRRERDAILKLVESRPPDQRGQRVLIDRVRGLEDSSRNWSLWMTLDHLRICHDAFAGIIAALAAGSPPAGKASTADVKPSPQAGPETEGAFVKSCDAFLSAAEAVPDLHTAARYEHPWFGALDADGWHALGGLHFRIHHRQIEKIIEGLR